MVAMHSLLWLWLEVTMVILSRVWGERDLVNTGSSCLEQMLHLLGQCGCFALILRISTLS